MRDQLSSGFTFIYKFLFPCVWLSGFSIGTVDMFVTGDSSAPFFAFGTILGFVIFRRMCFPLKRVIAAPNGLLISNFSEEVLIPYSQISDVNENKWINIRPITLVLKAPSQFGTKVLFMPYMHFTFALWKDHPVIEFLRSRIAG